MLQLCVIAAQFYSIDVRVYIRRINDDETDSLRIFLFLLCNGHFGNHVMRLLSTALQLAPMITRPARDSKERVRPQRQ